MYVPGQVEFTPLHGVFIVMFYRYTTSYDDSHVCKKIANKDGRFGGKKIAHILFVCLPLQICLLFDPLVRVHACVCLIHIILLELAFFALISALCVQG